MTLLNQGTRGDGESWTSWAFFKRDEDENEMNDEEIFNEAACSVNFYAFYRGAGHSFANGPYGRLNKHHILVSQSGGLDI